MDRAEQVAVLSGAAADQWGLVTAAQAKELGVNGVQLLRLTEAGLVSSVGRGVYLLTAVGVPPHLDVKVAWLRLQPKRFLWDRPVGGPDSGVVSHASACQLLDLGDIPAPEVEISVPRRRTTTEPFVRLRTAQVGTTEITTVDGLPVTTAVRTITDLLHAGADGGHIGGVIADAERRDLITVDDLAERVQPFARKYGLKASATGRDLINHLVAQAGERLRRQEVDRASQEGFDQALDLLAERPELIELMWATRAAARQQDNLPPTVSALSPALMESFRKLGQDPALLESLRRLSRQQEVIGESFRKLGENPAFLESLRRVSQPDPAVSEALRKAMLPLAESVRKVSQPDPAVSEALRKAMLPLAESVRKVSQPDLGVGRAVQQAAATFKAFGQAPAPAPAPERTSPSPRPSDAHGSATSSGGSGQGPDGGSGQGPEESGTQAD